MFSGLIVITLWGVLKFRYIVFMGVILLDLGVKGDVTF